MSKILIVLLLASSVVLGARQPGRRTFVEGPFPYSPTTGWLIDTGTHYTVQVVTENPISNPRTVNSILQVHLWRFRNGEWCDTETLQGVGGEQQINPIHFVAGDIILFEQWEGYRFVLRGYDNSNKKASETFAGVVTSVQHAQLPVTVQCN